MIIILFFATAPIFQIIASILRIKGHIGIPIGGIMFLMFFLGVIFSFVAMNTVELTPSPTGFRCGMPQMAVLFGGLFLQIIAIPLIAIISYAVYRFKRRSEGKLNTI